LGGLRTKKRLGTGIVNETKKVPKGWGRDHRNHANQSYLGRREASKQTHPRRKSTRRASIIRR